MTVKPLQPLLLLLLLGCSLLQQSVLALVCEQCALADFSAPSSSNTKQSSDDQNTRTDSNCDNWGTAITGTVTCAPDNVKYGKTLASGTEGTDFIYRCASFDVTMEYDYNTQGESGSDLRMNTRERGCVAVPPDSGFTETDYCYDFATNDFLISVKADLRPGLSFATGDRLASGVDSTVCFCTSDSCNIRYIDDRTVIQGEVVDQTTLANTDDDSTTHAESAASSLHLNLLLVLVILLTAGCALL